MLGNRLLYNRMNDCTKLRQIAFHSKLYGEFRLILFNLIFILTEERHFILTAIFMRKACISLFFVFLFSFSVFSQQHLQRKGGIGVAIENAPQSFFDRYGWATTKGVIITQILPFTTAEKMGLLVGDVIVDVNAKVITDVQSFLSLTSKIKPNEQVRFKVLRRSTSDVKSATLDLGKTDETSPDGTVYYDELEYEKGYLRTIIHKPQGQGNFPSIFYLQDYACTSIDLFATPDAPLKRLIDGWVSAGFVVFRVERPSIGDSDPIKKCESLTFDDEINIMTTSLKKLKRYDYVDSNKVFLFGHAFGGITAPILASQQKVKGVMVYGATLKPWMEHLIESFRYHANLREEDPAKTDEYMRKLFPIMYEWLILGKGGLELGKNEAYKSFLLKTDQPLRFANGTFLGRHASFFYNVQQKQMASIWRNLDVPVLSIFGECDTDAMNKEESEQIADIVNQLHKDKGTYIFMPKTEQNFVKVPPLEAYKTMIRKDGLPSEYVNMNFNAEIIQITTSWMKEQ